MTGIGNVKFCLKFRILNFLKFISEEIEIFENNNHFL